jgi:hypothetical protein
MGGVGRGGKGRGELMASPPPSSLLAGLPAGNSGGGVGRGRGRQGLRRGMGAAAHVALQDNAGAELRRTGNTRTVMYKKITSFDSHLIYW